MNYYKRSSNNKLLKRWYSMISRTTSVGTKDYPRYGGRGIKVCEEWQTYENFCDWALSNGFKEGLCLDRIDNDGDYSPDNCQWLTNSENVKKRWVDNPTLPPIPLERRQRISATLKKLNEENPELREKFKTFRGQRKTKISVEDIENIKEFKRNDPNWHKNWKIAYDKGGRGTHVRHFRFEILNKV